MKEHQLSIFGAEIQLVDDIRAVLLCQDCLLCGATSSRDILCRECAESLPGLPQNLCERCALPAPGSVCGSCLTQAPHFDATLARFRYAFPLDRLVHALKYQQCLAVAPWLAKTLLLGPRPNGDLMMALPLSAARLGRRGFNQALEIAKPLARALRMPLARQACLRPHDGAPQALLPWQERHRNVRGAFECTMDLTDKSVVVIDDVMTTGATLNEFARTLKKHGASRVTNWVVARAFRD